MKINVFRTQCKEGARVFFDGDITCTGTVRKISKDGSRALVCFDNGDVSWKKYNQTRSCPQAAFPRQILPIF